jgi:magnesium-transporting ATPase (P-type)
VAAIQRAWWNERLDAAARAGQRVLALAVADAPLGTTTIAEEDLVPQFRLLGFVCINDPPRAEVIASIAECRAAGVRVKMITGDHVTTAAAIGRVLGLAAEQPLEGRDIDRLSDAELGTRLAQTDVIARASPQHKLRLVQVLQAQGEVVAMTGDGANDAPALKRADIGVAMGVKGTDAAREAASIVLTDDNFASIANAVREGRTIYDNIKKALVFILPTNGGEAGVILLAVFLGIALPITALQILWINMVTTITQDIALAFEPAERDVMSRPPRPPKEALITPLLLFRVAYVTALLIAMTFWLFHHELDRGQSLEAARTAAVNMLVFGELVYLFNCRHFTAAAWGKYGFAGNPLMLWVSVAMIALQLAYTYVPAMQQLFGSAPLDATAWAFVLGLSAVKFTAVEAEKLVLRRLRVVRI